MSLDQIKDSQRLIGVLGQNAQYYFWSLSLPANTTWLGDVIDCGGMGRVSIYVVLRSGAPASLSSCGLLICPDNTGSQYDVWYVATANSSAGTTPGLIPPGRYIRPRVISGSTAGTYNVWVFLAIYPI